MDESPKIMPIITFIENFQKNKTIMTQNRSVEPAVGPGIVLTPRNYTEMEIDTPKFPSISVIRGQIHLQVTVPDLRCLWESQITATYSSTGR